MRRIAGSVTISSLAFLPLNRRLHLGMAAAPVRGGAPGCAWQYDPGLQQYTKTWRLEYCSLWKDEEGEQHPVIWTCTRIDRATDPQGYPAYKETWTWRFAEVATGRRSASRSPRRGAQGRG